ncbi:AraC family transcriptional regulator [Nitrosomonas sp.]|uniref:AraC family transcriptional regulator n=1 Tax=Nitrosomonas sp. TaxID=42353 RepID=UPI001DA6496D|nr:AraC family transcriptional regulator [Nitrosomonas sp.]MBX3617335.1 AraC family transcriptional regulator [Nitrosomonas sp.]
MKENLKELIEIVDKLNLSEGINETAIPILTIRKHSESITAHSIFTPLFCLNLQGNKEIDLGDEHYFYGPGQFILVSAELALTGRVTNVSKKNPFYGIIIEIDPLLIIDVLKDMPFYKKDKSTPKRALVVNTADNKIFDATKRLLLTLNAKDEIPILSKLYIKEILFRLLQIDSGQTLAQLGLMGSQFQRIKNSISFITNNFKDKLNVDELAHAAGMSTASFHKFFKEVTGFSPIQFQKKIRLIEARGLILSNSKGISDIAFSVGYESPSQFSREYSRKFGISPNEERLLKKH